MNSSIPGSSKIWIVIEFNVYSLAVLPSGNLDLIRIKFTPIFHIDTQLIFSKGHAIPLTIILAYTNSLDLNPVASLV